jgi:hypothetical protein
MPIFHKISSTAAAVILAGFLLPMAAFAGPKPVALFDNGHGERFLIADKGDLQLSSLADVLREAGFELRETSVPFTDASLAGADALVVSGPFGSITPAEADAVARFVGRGGSIAIMLHIAEPALPLLHRLGVAASNGVIHERRNVIGGKDTDFRLLDLAPHPLTAGVESFSARGVWAVTGISEGAPVIARTMPEAWVDLDGDGKLSALDAVQSLGVAIAGNIGKGHFAVFGDDAVFQNRFLVDGNLILARNLASWMKP